MSMPDVERDKSDCDLTLTPPDDDTALILFYIIINTVYTPQHIMVWGFDVWKCEVLSLGAFYIQVNVGAFCVESDFWGKWNVID